MWGTVISAVAAFAATNLDDIFLLMLYFAQAQGKRHRRTIIMGQYLGISGLILMSLLGGAVLGLLPEVFLRFLGLIPMALGIRLWLTHRRQQTVDPAEAKTEAKEERPASRALGVALVTIANGGDNLGVYTPLFSGATGAQMAVMILVFLVMVALWCFLGQRLATLPVLRRTIERHQGTIVPVVLVGLGVYILLGSIL
ncbi:MAG: cadmium transporter [Ruminococcaceae bacterium]|nr:cadmium transporter [Oscillospiraceae bacterium]